MITSIDIKSFKSFNNEKIPFKPLTLLSGLNNCGKSSLIQAMRMHINASKGGDVYLNGYGRFKELKSKLSKPELPIEIILDYNNGNVEVLRIHEQGEIEKPTFHPNVIYISADRLGPQAYLPLNIGSEVEIGVHGEFVIDFIQKLSLCIIPDTLSHPNSEGKTLEYELRGWLTEIAPGVNVNLHQNTKTDTSNAEFDGYRPKNVGFGLSYTLPIIAAVLGAVADRPSAGWSEDERWGEEWSAAKEQRGCLLILENPEAHLHPQGQTAMGKLIALAANHGVQVVIETHSDHLMDGIRIAAKRGLVNHEKIIFHYLSKDSTGETKIISPSIDANGKLDKWPDGFFDQTAINKALLAKKER
ncbi:AAA family ATPase [Aeromonas salmonicida]|uniref:AAA family ATPase n=1 Tax=Aeromonas salmonicida TaxID=645 RepID=UPI003D1DFD4F